MHVALPPTRNAAAALVAWGNAWLTGHVGLDEAVDAIEEASAPQVVGGLPDEPGEVPLRRALAVLRVAGMSTLRLALPVPGDPLGLTGPPALNAAAVEAGEAVLVSSPEGPIGLIPAEDLRGSSYVGVRWQAHEARPGTPDVPSLSEADHQLTLAMREATEALLAVDGTTGIPPEIVDALADLRDPARGSALAPGYPPRAHRVAALAGRLELVVDLARQLNGHGLTADQMAHRDEALRLLDRAARRALVAAHNSAFDPVR